MIENHRLQKFTNLDQGIKVLHICEVTIGGTFGQHSGGAGGSGPPERFRPGITQGEAPGQRCRGGIPCTGGIDHPLTGREGMKHTRIGAGDHPLFAAGDHQSGQPERAANFKGLLGQRSWRSGAYPESLMELLRVHLEDGGASRGGLEGRLARAVNEHRDLRAVGEGDQAGIKIPRHTLRQRTGQNDPLRMWEVCGEALDEVGLGGGWDRIAPGDDVAVPLMGLLDDHQGDPCFALDPYQVMGDAVPFQEAHQGLTVVPGDESQGGGWQVEGAQGHRRVKPLTAHAFNASGSQHAGAGGEGVNEVDPI